MTKKKKTAKKASKKEVSIQEAVLMAVDIAGSQTLLAEELTNFGHPISQATICYYVHNERKPSIKTALAIEKWSKRKIRREWLVPDIANWK